MNSRMRFIRTVGLLLAAAGIVTTSAIGQTTPYVYDFLRNDYSARAAAMAGAFSSVPDDPAGLFYNPALLNTVDSTTDIAFTGFKHLLDINSGSLVATTRMEGIGALGAGVTFNSYGTFERTDRTGNKVGEFGSRDLVLNLGWGTTLGEGFSAGVGAEALYSSIDTYSSFALALNGGLFFQDTAHNINAGLSILHLGTQVSTFDGVNEDLPLDLKLGVSHRLRGLPLLIALDFSHLLDDSEDALSRFASFSVGGEFSLSKPLRLRLGYDNRIRQNVTFDGSKGLGGLSAGLGVAVDAYRFDYAFNSLAGLGGMHRVTLNASF